MSTPLIKSRFLIDNKHLGDLFYDKDAVGRGYLKFSFKNLIADFVKGTDAPTTMPAVLKLDEPIKLELSYKFQDDFFSIKKIRKGKKPDYEFHKISLPPKTCLFYLRVKDLSLLDDVEDSTGNPLILDAPKDHNSIVVIFSFLGDKARPLAPPEYSNILMGCVDLPEQNLNKFCIGLAPDPQNNEKNNIIIIFPNSTS